jgi:putative membrane protein
MRRTGMAFQRTRMAADRTLMAVIRTSLSLITFGFTLSQVFKRLATAHVLGDTGGARHFGAALVLLGIGMLILGVIYHVMFMLALRVQRRKMHDLQLIYAESGFPASLTLIVAVLLLLLGIYAAISILER